MFFYFPPATRKRMAYQMTPPPVRPFNEPLTVSCSQWWILILRRTFLFSYSFPFPPLPPSPLPSPLPSHFFYLSRTASYSLTFLTAEINDESKQISKTIKTSPIIIYSFFLSFSFFSFYFNIYVDIDIFMAGQRITVGNEWLFDSVGRAEGCGGVFKEDAAIGASQ